MADEQRGKEHDASFSRQKPSDSGGITRREWLAELGAAALAAGLPAEARPAMPDRSAVSTELPPGLYVPSSEHLGHALESDNLFHAVPAGSETDFVRPIPGPFQPAFFSENEFATVRRLIELLLGLPESERSQTEAARQNEEHPADAVARWIDLRMASAAGVRRAVQALSAEHHAVAVGYYGAKTVHWLETEEPDRICREGLAWLGSVSKETHGAEFLRLQAPQQTEILDRLSNTGEREAGTAETTHFFALIKAEAIRGYYTSQPGLQELGYKGNSFYAESPGCNESRGERGRLG